MKAFHTCVVGDSGSGKTTLLREIYAVFSGYSVWIDHQRPGGISGRDLDDATTVRSLAELKAADATRIRYVTDDPEAALEELRPYLTTIYERTGWPVQVIVDEGHNVMPDGEDVDSGNVLASMLHEDRDCGVKVVVGSQDPQDLAYGPIKQCPYIVWVGSPSPFHTGFKNAYQLPGEKFPSEQYEYVVFHSEEPFEWNVAYRGETNPEYA